MLTDGYTQKSLHSCYVMGRTFPGVIQRYSQGRGGGAAQMRRKRSSGEIFLEEES